MPSESNPSQEVSPGGIDALRTKSEAAQGKLEGIMAQIGEAMHAAESIEEKREVAQRFRPMLEEAVREANEASTAYSQAAGVSESVIDFEEILRGLASPEDFGKAAKDFLAKKEDKE